MWGPEAGDDIARLAAAVADKPEGERLAALAAGILASDRRLANCMVWRCADHRMTLVTEVGQHSEECPLPTDGGISREAVGRSAPVLLHNNKAADRTLECYLGAGSELAVPVPGPAGQPMGALHVQSEQVEAFRPADADWLTRLAEVAGRLLLAEPVA